MAIGFVAVVVVVALVVLRPTDVVDAGDRLVVTSLVPTLSEPQVGRASELYGVPTGWSRDEAGATAAAVAYVTATEAVATAGPLERNDLIRAFCTEAFAPSLVASTNRELDEVLFALGGRGFSPSDLTWYEFPLTAKASVVTDASASVEVWSVSVISVDGGSVARQVWHAETVSLVWQDDDWKVAGWESSPGPTPGLGGEVELSSVTDVGAFAGRSPVDGRERD